MNQLLQQPFFQVTLPIVIAMVATVWALISTNNRRLDDIRADLKEVRAEMRELREQMKAEMREFRAQMNAELREIRGEIGNINDTLKIYGQKIVVLEERTSPLGRRG
jgi:uncharacterized coiled-coil DUF342 family protein